MKSSSKQQQQRGPVCGYEWRFHDPSTRRVMRQAWRYENIDRLQCNNKIVDAGATAVINAHMQKTTKRVHRKGSWRARFQQQVPATRAWTPRDIVALWWGTRCLRADGGKLNDSRGRRRRAKCTGVYRGHCRSAAGVPPEALAMAYPVQPVVWLDSRHAAALAACCCCRLFFAACAWLYLTFSPPVSAPSVYGLLSSPLLCVCFFSLFLNHVGDLRCGSAFSRLTDVAHAPRYWAHTTPASTSASHLDALGRGLLGGRLHIPRRLGDPRPCSRAVPRNCVHASSSMQPQRVPAPSSIQPQRNPTPSSMQPQSVQCSHRGFQLRRQCSHTQKAPAPPPMQPQRAPAPSLMQPQRVLVLMSMHPLRVPAPVSMQAQKVPAPTSTVAPSSIATTRTRNGKCNEQEIPK